MLELTDGKTLQFAAFLAPVSLFIVGCTPDWATSNFEYVLHNVGVCLAVAFSVVFTLLFPGLFWFLIGGTVFAVTFGLLFKREWLWFAELAVYLSMYGQITYLLYV